MCLRNFNSLFLVIIKIILSDPIFFQMLTFSLYLQPPSVELLTSKEITLHSLPYKRKVMTQKFNTFSLFLIKFSYLLILCFISSRHFLLFQLVSGFLYQIYCRLLKYFPFCTCSNLTSQIRSSHLGLLLANDYTLCLLITDVQSFLTAFFNNLSRNSSYCACHQNEVIYVSYVFRTSNSFRMASLYRLNKLVEKRILYLYHFLSYVLTIHFLCRWFVSNTF